MQMRHELIAFLNSQKLITDASDAVRRWKYNDLGRCIAEKYPEMAWEVSSPGTRLRFSGRNKWGMFISRLSEARRGLTYRQRQAAEKLKQLSTKAGAETTPEEYSSESAVLILQTLEREAASDTDISIERIKMLMKASFTVRRQEALRVIPTYMLQEELIAFESELMFGCRIEENEQKLKRFLEVASQVLKFTEPSYVSLDTYLRPRFAKHALMATTPPSDYIGPCLVWGERRLLICGREKETIEMSEDTSLEKALVMCLCLYYMKDLTYPAAYGQLLGFVQQIIKPGCSKEMSWANTRLRSLFTSLKI